MSAVSRTTLTSFKFANRVGQSASGGGGGVDGGHERADDGVERANGGVGRADDGQRGADQSDNGAVGGDRDFFAPLSVSCRCHFHFFRRRRQATDNFSKTNLVGALCNSNVGALSFRPFSRRPTLNTFSLAEFHHSMLRSKQQMNNKQKAMQQWLVRSKANSLHKGKIRLMILLVSSLLSLCCAGASPRARARARRSSFAARAASRGRASTTRARRARADGRRLELDVRGGRRARRVASRLLRCVQLHRSLADVESV